MAWTSPMTWADGSVLTAAQLNLHLRDNLLETMPARATTQGRFFVTDAKNRMIQRQFGAKTTLGNDATPADDITSTEYADHPSQPGPSVTLSTGDSAIIFFGCQLRCSTAGMTCLCSPAVTSNVENGNNIEPSDTYCIAKGSFAVNARFQTSHHVTFFDSLTPGSNTFKLMFRVSSGVGFMQRANILVWPVT